MKGLFEIIHESSRKYPDKTFIKSTDQAWTYRDTFSMSKRVSEYLLGCGVQKGDPVIIFCDNSIQYIAAYFGILRINAVAVPVNPAKMAESLLHIIEKCSSKFVIACDSTVDRLNKIERGLCAEIVNIDHSYIDISLAGNASEAPSGDPSEVKEIPDDMSEFSVEESDPAVILFTSGTTALPKGVTLTHGNLIANTRVIVEYLHLTGGDSILMTLPFTYSYGNSVLLTHAYAGACVIIEKSAAFPYKILEQIKANKVSGFSTVGSYINLMLKCMKPSGTEENFFENLRYITLAGETTNNDDIRFINRYYPNVSVYVMYGQTEAGARLSYLSPDLLRDKMGSVGKGLCNVELKVVNENGGLVKPGEIGEIIARGPNIMKGYWQDPAATEEVLKNGWLYTGDQATVDEDGYIYIKGRKTDMIKHMGHRISPVEIEDVINSCRVVRESAVVESTFETTVQIKAFIVPEEEGSPDEIIKFVQSRLPNYLRPQAFEFVEQLPRTESGKIKRSVLRGNK